MLLIIVKLLFFIGIFEAGLLIVHKYYHYTLREINNNVAGFIYSAIGVIYAVLLAFIVMNVWEQHIDAEKNLNSELSHTLDIYRNAEIFPPDVKKEVQSSCVRYLRDFIDYEFPAMQNLKTSDQSLKSYQALWNCFYSYKPASQFEQIWYTESIQELNELADTRRLRIISVQARIAPVMWIIIVLGAAITIGFGYMFGTKNQTAHQLMIILLSLTIGISLILIEQLDQPFAGLIKLSPDVYLAAVRQIAGK